jgi:Ca2+-binding EF-hand superfamily protein
LHLNNNIGTDPESRLRDAFRLFDEEGTGKLAEE